MQQNFNFQFFFQTEPPQPLLVRLLNLIRALWQALRHKLSQPVIDRDLSRHAHRLEDGLAMTLNGAVMSTGGPVLDASLLMFFASPMMKDLEQTVTLKCDVCVLSNYHNVFVMLDAILESGLEWPPDGVELS